MYRTTIEGDHALGGLPIDREASLAARQRIVELRQQMTGR
jgi:hypothetical protein